MSATARDAAIRPKADIPTIMDMLTKAWSERAQALLTPETESALATDLRLHLTALYPQEEMATLAKYGFARECDSVRVNVQHEQVQGQPHRYGTDVGVKVAPLLLPDGCHTLWCGIRYSCQQGRGLTDGYRAELEAKGEFAAFCAEQEERESRYTPERWDDWFRSVAAVIDGHKRDRGRAYTWADAFRRSHGRLPKWSDLRAAFPVLIPNT